MSETAVNDKCLYVRESTSVRLLTRLGEFPPDTKFVYRIEDWYYPDYDMGTEMFDGKGSSQLWYVGATKEQVPQWMYSLLLRANFYKHKEHDLKELFELEHKDEAPTQPHKDTKLEKEK